MKKYHMGKWRKYNLLKRTPELAAMLPHTRRLTQENFWALLDRYEQVILKPAGSSGGYGVMQVTALGDRKYEVHFNAVRKTFTGRDATYAFIRRRTNFAPYIVQQRIRLATIKGRPFDVRVMIQRKRGGSWTLTGELAKIAGPGYIITNTSRSKGRTATLPHAIRTSNIRGKSTEDIIEEIDRLSMMTVQKIAKHYRVKNIGLDMGIDAKGKVWFIETNDQPSLGLFRRLSDKSMYRRIMDYAKH